VRSLRFRITAVATVVVAVVLAFTAIVVVVAQQRALTDNLDDRLRRRADDVSALVESGSTPEVLAVDGDPDDSLAQLVTVSGEVVAASPNVAGEPPVANPSGDARERLQTVDRLPIDSDEFRLLTRHFDTNEASYALFVAAALDDVTENIAELGLVLAVVLAVVLVIVAALIWIVVGRALRPVEGIRAEVERITGSELDRRVPEPAGDDEIGRLARTMNAMLGRVEDAHVRQEQFVADASHELRSPLTNIRSELEVDLAHAGTADLLATHHSVLDETVRLQRLVDDLLYLARSDAGELPTRSEAVDLDEIVLRESMTIRARGRVMVDTARVSGAQVTGDRDQLTRAVRNVLDNAERHASSRISVSLREIDHHAELTVTDDGPGIPDDQADRIFERFTRIDDARDRGHGGTGLGLAITHDILTRHRGAISSSRSSSGGAEFRIRLPTSTGDATTTSTNDESR
jgi:signal transduction histidine kinase